MKTQLTLAFGFILVMAVSFSQNDTILIDFGSSTSALPWNNVTNAKTGQINGLKNTFGSTTNMGISVFDEFNDINTNGTQSANASLGIPSSASEDSFYGNMISFGGEVQPTGGVELSNLDPTEPYTITIFSSRTATDNRETRYEFTGATVQNLYLDVASNTDSVVTATLYPASNGIIQVVASMGLNNTNSYGFFYLGAMKISYKHKKELNLRSPNGGEFWQVGKTTSILWNSLNVSQVSLDYSTDNGSSWTNIDTVSAFLNKYDWLIPNTPSTQCLVRVQWDTVIDESDNVFDISNSTDTCLIVVLGSSTAAGSGPSTADSAWVNRYRKNIYQRNTSVQVTNLARGGYNTFHIIPTNTPVPGWVGTSVDVNRNLTKALTLNPYAIIVNMPSNDASGNIGVYHQMNNFRSIVDSAATQGVQTWIATTQPRNFSDGNKIQIQKDARDSILAVYGDNAIDFWTGFAEPNGFIVSTYDSGDGIHLNDEGHRILVNRVLAKMIDTLCGGTNGSIGIEEKTIEGSSIKVYPNPFKENITIEFQTEGNSLVEISIHDMLGRKLSSVKKNVSGSGKQTINWEPTLPSNLNSAILFARVIIKKAGNMVTKDVRLVYSK